MDENTKAGEFEKFEKKIFPTTQFPDNRIFIIFVVQKKIIMPELVIKYSNKKTLQALMDLAKYFDFSVVLPQSANPEASGGKSKKIKGVTVITANSSIDTSYLESVFSHKNIDAKNLRKKAWQRDK